MLKPEPFGILGVDSIVPSEGETYQAAASAGDKVRSSTNHPYGLSDELFTPSNVVKELESRYQESIAHLEDQYRLRKMELNSRRIAAQEMQDREDNPLTEGLGDLLTALQVKPASNEQHSNQAKFKSNANATIEPEGQTRAEKTKEYERLFEGRAKLITNIRETLVHNAAG